MMPQDEVIAMRVINGTPTKVDAILRRVDGKVQDRTKAVTFFDKDDKEITDDKTEAVTGKTTTPRKRVLDDLTNIEVIDEDKVRKITLFSTAKKALDLDLNPPELVIVTKKDIEKAKKIPELNNPENSLGEQKFDDIPAKHSKKRKELKTQNAVMKGLPARPAKALSVLEESHPDLRTYSDEKLAQICKEAGIITDAEWTHALAKSLVSDGVKPQVHTNLAAAPKATNNKTKNPETVARKFVKQRKYPTASFSAKVALEPNPKRGIFKGKYKPIATRYSHFFKLNKTVVVHHVDAKNTSPATPHSAVYLQAIVEEYFDAELSKPKL